MNEQHPSDSEQDITEHTPEPAAPSMPTPDSTPEAANECSQTAERVLEAGDSDLTAAPAPDTRPDLEPGEAAPPDAALKPEPDPSSASETVASEETGASDTVASEETALPLPAKRVLRFQKRIRKARKNPSPRRIHALRTAGRQLEPLLLLLEKDPERHSDTDGRLLVRTIGAFSKLRGLDVAVELLRGLAGQAESGLALTDPGMKDLLRWLKKRRSLLRAKALRTLQRTPKRLRRLLSLLYILPELHTDWAEALDAKVIGLAQTLLVQLEAGQLAPLDAQALHQVRLSAKSLRYVLAMLPGDRYASTISVLTQAQKVLGHQRDVSGLEDWVTKRRTKVLAKRKKEALRPALAGIEALVRVRVDDATGALGPMMTTLREAMAQLLEGASSQAPAAPTEDDSITPESSSVEQQTPADPGLAPAEDRGHDQD